MRRPGVGRNRTGTQSLRADTDARRITRVFVVPPSRPATRRPRLQSFQASTPRLDFAGAHSAPRAVFFLRTVAGTRRQPISSEDLWNSYDAAVGCRPQERRPGREAAVVRQGNISTVPQDSGTVGVTCSASVNGIYGCRQDCARCSAVSTSPTRNSPISRRHRMPRTPASSNRWSSRSAPASAISTRRDPRPSSRHATRHVPYAADGSCSRESSRWCKASARARRTVSAILKPPGQSAPD